MHESKAAAWLDQRTWALDSIVNENYYHSNMSETLSKAADGGVATQRPLTSTGSAPCKILSQALFKGSREVVIEHGDREYRLRVTASGKLILTA